MSPPGTDRRFAAPHKLREQHLDKRTSRPSRKLMQFTWPGDNQGMTELIAAPRQSPSGTVTRALHQSGLGAIMKRYGRRFSS
jgi:hypothetical protein